jgi:hypothetical protein
VFDETTAYLMPRSAAVLTADSIAAFVFPRPSFSKYILTPLPEILAGNIITHTEKNINGKHKPATEI